jgi:hypothetical protein
MAGRHSKRAGAHVGIPGQRIIRLWVPNWSSTACDIAGSGSPTLCRAIPVESVLVAASTSSKRALGHRHLAEPSTTMITGALTRATEGFTTGAPSCHAGAHQRSAL